MGTFRYKSLIGLVGLLVDKGDSLVLIFERCSTNGRASCNTSVLQSIEAYKNISCKKLNCNCSCVAQGTNEWTCNKIKCINLCAKYFYKKSKI